ncbi:hypothetical protein halTADL_0345 [Halohasta litchfieldiae]|jgi:predicted DNA-binding protein (UPF0251 family)|uniref:Sigma-70, region 4 n=1 Tax=Halohasta litchfieldiae TaxID=1073996 RepID=A0A1H6U7N3_9EURY|nr:hypothetical protein [Halohasta litchfieldiae]ATW87161.1 hypothetical protein halTADL_0345 [Halohasta litchfieldiae]SEI84320.1 hypothetical protein SAMN05444271_10961 [Halohasta litchfieldiae]
MAERGPELSAPERIESGEFAGALRIGSQNEREVYWYVPKNLIIETEAPETAPDDAETYRLSEETVGEYIHRTERDGSVWTLNQLGEFLRNVASFRDVRILTLRQEEAYALCRISGVDSTTASELLGISETLLNDHLSTAQKKITCAFNLVEAVNKH